MRRKVSVICLLISVMILTLSCGNKDDDIFVTEDIIGSCEQSAYLSGRTQIAIAPEGYYTLSGLGYDMYISYISKSSAKEIFLCNKPDCVHARDEYWATAIDTCNAYTGCTLPDSIVYHNGYVYVLRYDISTHDVTLTKISADGSVHEDIMVVGQSPDTGNFYKYLFADDNTIYMVYDPPDFTGEERTVDIQKIDLEKKEKTSVYEYTEKGATITYMKLFEGSIFFIRSKRTGELDKYMYTYQLMKYDTASGETEIIVDDNVFSYTIADNGQLFYQVPLSGLYKYNLQTMQTELILKSEEETMYGGLCYDGTYIYLDNVDVRYYYNEECEHKVFVYDLDGKTVNEIPVDVNISILLSDKDYMIDNWYFTGWTYIKKTDITNPSVTWSIVDR